MSFPKNRLSNDPASVLDQIEQLLDLFDVPPAEGDAMTPGPVLRLTSYLSQHSKADRFLFYSDQEHHVTLHIERRLIWHPAGAYWVIRNNFGELADRSFNWRIEYPESRKEAHFRLATRFASYQEAAAVAVVVAEKMINRINKARFDELERRKVS